MIEKILINLTKTIMQIIDLTYREQKPFCFSSFSVIRQNNNGTRESYTLMFPLIMHIS